MSNSNVGAYFSQGDDGAQCLVHFDHLSALLLGEEEVGSDFASRSAKLMRLDEILEEVVEAGDRALLFTQFAGWGHLLQSFLQQRWRQPIQRPVAGV